MADVIILDEVQRELNEIARLHYHLVGPESAERILKQIYKSLSRLREFPLSGPIVMDRELDRMGYRYIVSGKYLCFYRVADDKVYIYHVVDVRSNYPQLMKKF